jgi:protein-L-isoaspartate(D-aspartate) O-methyltransferase
LGIDFGSARSRLIEHLRREIRDERVLGAMSRVPRELFVPSAHWHAAYDDRPLPLDHGQTISQPMIVALMTEAAGLVGDEKVLEVGTGSGYQAAVLAELARRVVTVERHEELATRAREIVERLGYTNVEVHLAEPTLGWYHEAPYDAIVVTAGAPSIPQELVDQLRPGGRMLIPVGSLYEQRLLKVTRLRDEVAIENLGPCRWVPLVGEGAWDNSDV